MKYRSGIAALTRVAGVISLAVMLTACEERDEERWRVEGGDAESGSRLMEFYDCGSCHVIPGIRKANGVVGPPLNFWSRRGLIAGAITNNPDNLIQWIVDPQSIEPGTAMPDLGVTEAEARDMAAYLYTLE